MNPSMLTLIALTLITTGCRTKNDACTLCDTGGGAPENPSPDGESVDPDGGDETGSADGGDETGATEDGFTDVVGPCSDGGWGTITDPANTLHFWGGSDENSIAGAESLGEMNAPYQNWTDFEAARAATPDMTIAAIGLWSGSHALPASAIAELSTNGTPILGCGSSEVTITLSTDGTTPDAPLIEIGAGMTASLNGLDLTGTGTGPVLSVVDGGTATLTDMRVTGGFAAPTLWAEGTSSLSVSDSVISGGTTGIWTSGGTTNLTASDVQVSGSQGAGIWTSGGTTSLIDVQISGITTMPGITEGVGGWGLVLRGDDIVAHNITIDGAIRAGLVASVSGTASIKDVTVENISGADGTWGRGIYLEGGYASGYVNLENITVRNVFEAGLFIQDVPSTDLHNITVEGVHTHTAAYGSEVSNGDGLVLVQTSEAGEEVDPSVVSAQMTGSNSFTSIDRAGIIAHGAYLQLTVPMSIDAGEARGDSQIFTQGSGKVDFIPTEGVYEEDTSSSYEELVAECGDEDSYHLVCDGFDFDSMR